MFVQTPSVLNMNALLWYHSSGLRAQPSPPIGGKSGKKEKSSAQCKKFPFIVQKFFE